MLCRNGLAERNLCGTLGVDLQHFALRVFCKLLLLLVAPPIFHCNGQRLAHHDHIAHAPRPTEPAVVAKVAVVGDRAQHAQVGCVWPSL
jgi:hypothetical protein